MPALSDADIISLMSAALHEGLDAGLAAGTDAVAQFAEYLAACGTDGIPDEAQNARIADLIGELTELRIAGNGGDRRARAAIRAIDDLLNSALADRAFAPIDLIMTGKILSDAGWTVPGRLKQAVAQALQSAINEAAPIAASDLSPLLTQFPGDGDNDPFDMHELVASLLAALPAAACGQLLSAFAALGRPEVNHALAGFVVHADAVVAGAATDALRTLAGHAPLDSRLIERLVHMRPWLPAARQADLDATMKALRPHAAPPHEQTLPELTGCYVSVCDGSGTSSVSLTQRAGADYRLASIMIKPSGISDVMVIPGLSRVELAELLHQMKSSMPTNKTDAAGIVRMLSLALADNATSATLPPFRLIEVVESLGLPPLHPDHASPAEIVDGLLAGLPAGETNAPATAKAHADLLNEDFVEQWFEAGAGLDDLLHPLTGFAQRVAAIMTTYLPPRRQFWARQCAMSALAMRANPRRSSWKRLALVGRDIAADPPLERIPLMQRVAATSVLMFESQL